MKWFDQDPVVCTVAGQSCAAFVA